MGGQAILGNDVPSNSRLFSISMLMVGAVLVATIFGNMTVLLANADAQTRAHYEKVERVKQSLVRMEVTPKLQSRVIKYYEYMWRRQKSGTDGQQGNFVSELPMALRAEVQLHLHEQLVVKVPFFNGCDRCASSCAPGCLRFERAMLSQTVSSCFSAVADCSCRT